MRVQRRFSELHHGVLIIGQGIAHAGKVLITIQGQLLPQFWLQVAYEHTLQVIIWRGKGDLS